MRMFVIFLSIITAANIFWVVPALFNYALIAFGLGLRHGLDADHIIIIDNVTRKLVNDNKASKSTGLFFALGHSTIVFILTLTIVSGIKYSQSQFIQLNQFGNRFGSLISILLLGLTLIMNLTLYKSISQSSPGDVPSNSLIYRIRSNYLLQYVDSPHKMFIIGFLFGLGFDTATEVGLLSLAASSLLHGMNVYLILLLPTIFACGMVVTDTVNSYFMTKVYLRLNYDRRLLKFYNYFILTFASFATVIVMLVEIVNYCNQILGFNYQLFQKMIFFGDKSEIMGIGIIAVFTVLGISVYFNSENKRET